MILKYVLGALCKNACTEVQRLCDSYNLFAEVINELQGILYKEIKCKHKISRSLLRGLVCEHTKGSKRIRIGKHHKCHKLQLYIQSVSNLLQISRISEVVLAKFVNVLSSMFPGFPNSSFFGPMDHFLEVQKCKSTPSGSHRGLRGRETMWSTNVCIFS